MACLGVGFGGDSLLAYFSAPHFALLILFFPFLPVLFPLTLLEYVVWNCDGCPLTCRCELLHLVPSLFWRITVFILYFSWLLCLSNFAECICAAKTRGYPLQILQTG